MSDMQSFSREKQRAIDEMFNMNKKAVQSDPLPKSNTASIAHDFSKNRGNKIDISLSPDDMMIIGLILILSDDCRDMRLFFALVYILLG